MSWRWVFLAPLAVFVVVGVILGVGLTRDPSELPSALLDDPVPTFDLPGVPGRDDNGLASEHLQGQPMLVNIFASWCVPCRIEHPILARLAQEEGVVVQGINYKDKPEEALAFLRELGDPFERIGLDQEGRVGIDWGVYGVPETYVIDARGRIVHRHVGPLQARDVERTILPLLEQLEVS